MDTLSFYIYTIYMELYGKSSNVTLTNPEKFYPIQVLLIT